MDCRQSTFAQAVMGLDTNLLVSYLALLAFNAGSRHPGANTSTRSVMMPSVPRSINLCAAHSSFTV